MPQVISRHSARILRHEKQKKQQEEKDLIDKYILEEKQKNLSVSFEDQNINQKK